MFNTAELKVQISSYWLAFCVNNTLINTLYMQ